MKNKEKPTNPKDSLGIKKVPIHVVSMPVLAELGLAMMEGARKYGAHNYRNSGVRASVYIDAVWRHLFLQFWEGEDIDKDSGVHHIAKAIACLCVLRDAMLADNWVDDRPLKYNVNVDNFNKQASNIIEKYPKCKDPFIEKNRGEK